MAPEDLFYGPILLGKGPREQYKGIHDVVNDQGFAFQMRSAIWKFYDVRESIQQSKTLDGLTSFLC